MTDTNTKTEEENTAEVTVQNVSAQIDAFVEEAYRALKKAEDLAIEHKTSFSFSPAYGMGGSFEGYVEEDETDEWGDAKEPGWCPSSQSC